MSKACARRPTAELKEEHQVILRVLDVLEVLTDRSEDGGPFEREALERCVQFFSLFADACHHAKEETELFPVLELKGVPREGGPIGVMLHEHQIARGLIRSMKDALASPEASPEDEARFRTTARNYLHLLRQHIMKEDNILFEIGDQVMGPEDQERLADRFCAVACRTFDGLRTEQLTAMADQLEASWGSGA